jgi:FAD/FMN-containing dehydrogenase
MDDGHEEVLMQASIPQPRSLSIDRLRTDLRGDVLAPGDPGYDEARTVFPGNVDRHPAVVVRPIDAEEVSAVVSVARETGLELAVKSGGHSGPGFGVSDGGIVLDLSAMKGLDIDADGRSAWAETGLTAGEYPTAAGAHGLATGFGDTGSVGIGGITLGGGIGFLVRKHGLTIDDLLAAEVVTADGRLLHVDENTHPDLFWAIRGGGGNFGVATRFRFRLHDVPSIVGGILMLPATPEVIASFVAEAEAAPDELSTIAPATRRRANAPWLRSGRSPSRWRTCSARCRIPSSTCPTKRGITRSPWGTRGSPITSTRRRRRPSSTTSPRRRR